MLQWKASGKPILAIFYGKQAINNYQQLRGNIQGLEKPLQKNFLGKVEYSYRTLASLLIAQGRIPEAERVLEMLKEEEFFQYARRDKAVASALLARADLRVDEQKALDEYSQIADQLTSIGTELTGLESDRLKLPEDVAFPQQARLDELKGKLAAAIKSFQVFQRQLEEEFGKTNVRVAEVESGLQSDLKAWGTSDAVIISTIIGADRLQIIVTTPNVQEPHTIEIWFAQPPAGHTLYMLSGGRDRSDWVKNIVADPVVQVRIGSQEFQGRGRLIADGEEEQLARRLVVKKASPTPALRGMKAPSTIGRPAVPCSVVTPDVMVNGAAE
jgi:hypothetical protein